MFIKVVKNPKESFERLVSRFQKAVTQSRKILHVKNRRFHKKKPKTRQVRSAAVMRAHYRAERSRRQFY